MKVGRLSDFLVKMYEAEEGRDERTSLLLLGPPGVGKSEAVREAARLLAARLRRKFIEYGDDIAEDVLSSPQEYFVLVDFRLTECEPSDLLGIPRDVNHAVKYAPLLWARVLSKTAGILFLDELTNVNRPDVLSATYKLILDRKAGFVRFSRGVMVVAAGNRPEESSVANMLPAPLVNRTLVLVVDQPAVDEWAGWMVRKHGDAWDRRTYAFLKRFESEGYLLKVPKNPETLSNYPTPRSWTKAALLLSQGLEDREVLVGLLGEEVGTRLSAFLQLKVDVEDLLRDPGRFRGLTLDSKYVAAVMLGSWIEGAKEVEWSRALTLLDAMREESWEFVVLTCTSIRKAALARFLKRLFAHNREYEEKLLKVSALAAALKA